MPKTTSKYGWRLFGLDDNLDMTIVNEAVEGIEDSLTVELDRKADITVFESGRQYRTGRVYQAGANIFNEFFMQVSLGNLPNNARKNIPHGVINAIDVRIDTGLSFVMDGASRLPIVFVWHNQSQNISAYIDNGNISVQTWGNYSSAWGMVTLRYLRHV